MYKSPIEKKYCFHPRSVINLIDILSVTKINIVAEAIAKIFMFEYCQTLEAISVIFFFFFFGVLYP